MENWRFFTSLVAHDADVELRHTGKFLPSFPLAIMAKMANAAAVATARSSTSRTSTRNYLEYVTFRIFESAFRVLPPTWVDALGRLLGRLAYYVVPGRRAIVIRNLRIAWGEKYDAAAIESLARETFRHVGANLLGGVRCMLMSEEQIRQRVTIEGDEIMREHLKTSGHSAIAALAHMGNWEILARIASLVAPGVPSGAFFRPLNNRLMNDMTMRRRKQSGTQLFSNKEGFVQSCSLLRSGGMLGILADQHAGGSGSLTPFFGRMTSCSPLVELLHRRTNAAIFFVSVKRTRTAHWHITITAHDAANKITTHSVMSGVEAALSQSPCDGFWLHNRWKMSRKQPFLNQHTRHSNDGSLITKPWRYAIVGSINTAIAAASVPAIKHLLAQQPEVEFHLINLPSIDGFANASHLEITDLDDLGVTLRTLDAEKSYPLDMVVYFCPQASAMKQHKRTAIPVSVGMSSENHTELTIRVKPPQTAIDDPQTWWHYLQVLGCMPPTSPA